MEKMMNAITQNKFTLFRFKIGILILLLFPLTSNAKNEKVFWEARYDYVALEEVGAKNDHPVTLSPKDVYQLLASIRLQDAESSWIDLYFFDFTSDKDQDENAEYRLFNQSELKRLSPPIAKALSNAKSNEDVTFTIASSHSQLLGKGSLSTSGRIFFSDGQLNLIIGELRVDIEQKYRQRGGYSDVAEKIDYNKLKRFRLKTGSRGSESDIDYAFVTDDAHFLKPYKSKFRKDWLLIDVASMQNIIAEREQKAERKENIVEETVDIKQQTQQIDKEQEELKLKVERMERYLEAKEKLEAEDKRDRILERTERTPKKQAVQKTRTLEERLTELKSLKEKGFITEDIYQQKMKEILSDL
jgi:hypothetical protein